jgi:predicted naringenin-chalcone synthase
MIGSSNTARLLAFRTRVPSFHASQEELARFMSQVLQHSCTASDTDRWLAFVDRVYSHGGIEKRYSVLPDFNRTDPADFEFFPRRWSLDPFPTTAQRMAVYERESVALAIRVAEDALAASGVRRSDVTHVIVGTCTGFMAPGLDVRLCDVLGLSPNVSRTLIGFMGCYAGFTGMRTAAEIIAGNPRAVVLQVSVELCTLHFQRRAIEDFIVANSLFGDGSAAAVYGGQPASESSGRAIAEIRRTRSDLRLSSGEEMSWRIGDHGFEMRLSNLVPGSLRASVPPFVASILQESGLDRDSVVGWAIHPGGRRILDEIEDVLGLSVEDLAASREVLAKYGNMSSATLFFVLERLLLGSGKRGPVVALGFGPGLTLEGALIETF